MIVNERFFPLNSDVELSNKVIGDLNHLKWMTEDLSQGLHECLINSEKYLQLEALHILPLSKLEYFLRTRGLITRQSGIIKIIKNSTILNQLEKEHLIYFYYIRHTIVHRGGYFDEEFFNDIKKADLKRLKIEFDFQSSQDDNSLSPIHPQDVVKYIELIIKLVIEINDNFSLKKL
ncbi:hypothetical protein V7O61_02325 [Methanolobus sp. WCC1]|uniref:hypothetical protein n=1 Tax=unclassified Methanolobus TaxID=2629569 RepID=UPI0032457B4A